MIDIIGIIKTNIHAKESKFSFDKSSISVAHTIISKIINMVDCVVRDKVTIV
tara:strand:+ start:1488 stop:1643 length:156 start_codon:yes stop_codon:yes gene_type:complete